MIADELSNPVTDGLDVVVTSVASDSHTWNLVHLQLVLEELGHRVRNLGACVPDDLLVSECLRQRPDLVAIGTGNGHGLTDGTRVIGRLRSHPELAQVPVVIGGKLGITDRGTRDRAAALRAAGFDAVFEDGNATAEFRAFVRRLRVGVST
ncbi:MAG TPA: cobalamin-dependent protein [Actinophytocola sp.]|nr:cobalamin-dependent protein [Actinophytocola sp.]